MAGETLSPAPSAVWPFIALELRAQLYPTITASDLTTRPSVGQAWPRGNARGNG